MTLDLNNMTQAEFDDFMADIKARNPNLLQFITDILDRKITPEEVDDLLNMEQAEQVEYIENYQAKA